MSRLLGDVAEIVMGQSPSGDRVSEAAIGLPLLNGPTEFGHSHPHPKQYTDDARKRAQPADVLFCVRGSTTGRMNWADRDYAIGRGIAAIRHRTNLALQPLVRAVIEYALPGLLRQATGSTFPNVSGSQIGELPFPDLPDDDLKACASILGALDDKIELNRSMSATLEAMARALFTSWFIDFDPVRAKAEGRETGLAFEIAQLFSETFVTSAHGGIPSGWRMSTLGREADRCGGSIQTGPFGSQLHAADYRIEGIPIVMPQDIARRRVSTSRIARISDADAERLSRHRVRVGDIVYSRRGDVERHALIGEREKGWLCGTGCLLVRLGSRWPSPTFASFSLDTPDTRAWLSLHAIGATMPNLNTSILSSTPLIVPPDLLIESFDRMVVPFDARQVANDAQNATLVAMRDALLPRLISGELQVTDAGRILERSA